MDADYVLSPPELTALNTELKSIVWVLKLSLPSDYEIRTVNTFATAFSIDENGLIMTSAHLFRKHAYQISARKLNDDKFLHEAEVVEIKSKWDIALLRVKNVSDCSFGRLATDSSLLVGQNVLHIGHSGNFVGSFLVGKVVFPCVRVPLDNQICRNYICTALDITPRYRIMGHIWNTDVLMKVDQHNYAFEGQLHPQIPVIQIRGLGFTNSCSGGPVFNTKGEIVGMMSMGYMDFEIAIHSSLFQQVLSEIVEEK
ncbi:uncharacterized protein LOC126687162 [Mercurialis annua]|uniref:uncharacterized protein LOC126687162 n=1 Tax=Mercurialis annua TaxID=3986 RepID=UPI00215F6450|nr:uncharacterized protein LOC126687162 [Mercurialis annua]